MQQPTTSSSLIGVLLKASIAALIVGALASVALPQKEQSTTPAKPAERETNFTVVGGDSVHKHK